MQYSRICNIIQCMFDPNTAIYEATIIPDKCSDCSLQRGLADQLANLILDKIGITELGVALMGEAFEEGVDANIPTEYAEEVKRAVRQTATTDLDDLDHDIESLTNIMRENSTICEGTIKMRATDRGKIYTVTMCRLLVDLCINTHQGQAINYIPVHINTNPAND